MNVTIQQMERLLKSDLKFKQISFAMLLTRLKGDYNAAPGPENLENSLNQVNTFLGKFAVIMADDYAIIEKI